MAYDETALFTSPFPIIDRVASHAPQDGLTFRTPEHCRKHFGPKCQQFYASATDHRRPVQCPCGFAAYPFSLSGRPFAVTGVVPFPRLGGPAERNRAKSASENHVLSERVIAWIEDLERIAQAIAQQERQQVTSHIEALHEVRRLNQTIKVVTERVCTRDNPQAPEQANPDLVRVWKASELISHHLDALDILANPELARTAPNKRVVFYKVVDKIYRIYRPRALEKNLEFVLLGRSVAFAHVYDGTIHIAPSVFIDNAIKYSPRGGRVEVKVFEGYSDGRATVGFEVVSTGPSATPQEESQLFRVRGRGLQARAHAEGSGIGLLLAKTVSDQHAAAVSAKQDLGMGTMSEWTFRFEMPVSG